MARSWTFAVSLGLFLVARSVPLSADSPHQITGFSPSGAVKDVRQARASFSDDMIRFGDPRAEAPFDISCPASGKGRWADARNWVYDFDKDLPAGLRCTFKAKDRLKTLSGASLSGTLQYSFETGGPAIKSTEPYEGGSADEEQIFIVHTDAEADPKSVVSHAYFTVSGINEKIPIEVVDQDPRLDAGSHAASWTSRFKLWAHKFGVPNRAGTEKAGVSEIYLRAKRKFPPNAAITLNWEAGIATPGGAVTTEAQTLPYKVRPEFSAEFSCDRESAQAPCMPILPMQLFFNSPLRCADAGKIRLRAMRSGQEWKPAGLKCNDKESGEYNVDRIVFSAPLPEKSQFQITLPGNLKDDAGRSLSNASHFPLATTTGEFPPLLKFPAEFGILELKPEAVLPLTVRNVEPELKGRISAVSGAGGTLALEGKSLRLNAGSFEQTISWLQNVLLAEREKSVFGDSHLKLEPLSLRKPGGDRAFEVVGIPLKKPGFYVVEFESPRLGAALLGKNVPMYVPTAALVTNLSVHFKLGRKSSLAWVTTLDGGKPVEGAAVTVRTCSGKVVDRGTTDARGIANLGGEKAAETCSAGLERSTEYSGGLFIVAEKDDDFSFVHTSWDKGIESWRFNLPGESILPETYAATVLDRALFRAGETVHMKHFLRRHEPKGIGLAEGRVPDALRIRHDESDESYDLPLSWRADGVSESTWTIPKDAKLGTYSLELLDNRYKTTIPTGQFRIEEYRIPLMRARLKTPERDQIAVKEVPIDLSVEYFSGGAASKLPVSVRYQASNAEMVEFADYDGFSIANGKARKPAYLSDPDSDDVDVDAPAPSQTSGPEGATAAQKIALTLDGTGTGRAVIPVPKGPKDRIRRLHIECDYPDPNGEIQTTARTVSIYPSSRLVAIRPDGWFSTLKSLKFQVLVTDLKGKPVPQSPVSVEFVEQKTYSHRKRLVGGFYAYENRAELNRRGTACKGKTDEKGLLECETKPPVAGNLILEAKTTDPSGNESYANASTWVYDQEEWWFSQDDSDRIDFLPEHRRYEPGQTATFQLRMPFREATALVTVEREGILDSYVMPVSGKKPLIEVPIKPEYAPNVFVSALVVRGRVADPQPTALVDLARPSYKLGISEVNVGWKAHELSVRLTSAKDIYQTREKGHFKVQVTRADGGALPKGSEIALAAVDEGLLQLKPNDSWKLLDSMMARRGYEVQTYTAQSQVVGKRHFGLKALAQGGDGGKAPARQILDSLLYWNGKIALDARGEAEIEFPMNDSITGFRLAAVAHSGPALFGTGYAEIHTTQDLMILAGAPPVAREGDRLNLQFTLRNTTERAMDVTLAGTARGVRDLKQELPLAPGQAKQVSWNVEIPIGVAALDYELNVQDGASKASDRLKVHQKILPAVPVRVLQATLAQLDSKYDLSVERPKDALQGAGEVRVSLAPTVVSGLDGVRSYMDGYPYACLEQRVSKAIVARDKKLWNAVLNDLPSYLDSDGLVKYFPTDWLAGSDILTAYVLSVSNEAGWDIPEATREKMLAGMEHFVDGTITRISELKTSDLTVRKLAALEAISRYDRAKWTMTGSLQITPDLWPTSALIDWSLLLRRLKDVPDAEKRRAEAGQILRSRLNFQGTIMGFSTENVDQLWWMMVSTSVNANRFLLSVLDDPAWKGDMGRLARGAMSRQVGGRWDTTTANAWGTLAIEKFAREFEKSPVDGKTRAELEGSQGEEKEKSKAQSIDWAKDPEGATMDFPWPEGSGKLSVAHSGGGKPWITVQSRAALPLKEPLSSGYKIRRTWAAVEQKHAGKWTRGDIVRVRLELESQSDMTWVVVNDPIPAGATILGSGLGNDSGISTTGEIAEGWTIPAYQERAFDGYRAYYQYVPKGKWVAEYSIRLNQSGQMGLPPTRVEAMYSPEMFGESPNESVTISE